MADISESVIKKVLLALWAQRETTLDRLAAAAAVAESQVTQSIGALQGRQCLIEFRTEKIELIQAGLPCWRDILGETGTHLVSAAAEQYSGDQNRPADKKLGASPFRSLGVRSLIFQNTSSTNDVCRQYTADASAHGLVVLADEQTSGRGRRGNVWLAKPGQSILMSILLRDVPSANLDTLTLQLGLAAAQAIEQTTDVDSTLKWPNDVLLGDRKVAGVLVETYPGTATGSQHVVLGIGLNVTQTLSDFPESIRSRAGSLYLATGETFDRLRIIIMLLERIEAICISGMPLDEWLPAWKTRCPVLGRTIKAHTSDSVFTGQILDIDPFHGLVLLDQSGSRHFLSARTTTLNPE